MSYLVGITWFLWATMIPVGESYFEKDLIARPVKEFKNQSDCEKGLKVYRIEVDKAYPEPKNPGNDKVYLLPPHTYVELKCSPIYPR